MKMIFEDKCEYSTSFYYDDKLERPSQWYKNIIFPKRTALRNLTSKWGG
jgi:hypothetical protein